MIDDTLRIFLSDQSELDNKICMNEWERTKINIHTLYGGKDPSNVLCSSRNRSSAFSASIFVYIFPAILKNICHDVLDWTKISNRWQVNKNHTYLISRSNLFPTLKKGKKRSGNKDFAIHYYKHKNIVFLGTLSLHTSLSF